MTARTAFALALCCALTSIGTTGAATLTNYPDEDSFRAALGPNVALTEENWDGIPETTVIDTQVSGVVFSSPGASIPLQVFHTNRAITRPAISSLVRPRSLKIYN